MKTINKYINHYLISHGTSYYAEDHEDPYLTIIYGPSILCNREGPSKIFKSQDLLDLLKECGSTEDVRNVLNGNLD